MRGIVYPHEHITIDLSGVKDDPDCHLRCYNETLSELKELKERGVKAIVDVTNRGIGRDPLYIEKVALEAGLQIVHSTGFYKEPFFPKEVEELSINRLADLMIFEIEEGIEGTGIKAGVIGEVGSSHNKITPLEEKVFKAAARAQRETGVPLFTHTSLGTMGIEQIDLLTKESVELERVVIGHPALSDNESYLLEILKRGVYICFDTVGKTGYLSEEKRIQFIQRTLKEGFEKRLLSSLDLTRQSHLKSKGGIGYSYLIDSFIPALRRAGVEEKQLEQIFVLNPAQLLKGIINENIST